MSEKRADVVEVDGNKSVENSGLVTAYPAAVVAAPVGPAIPLPAPRLPSPEEELYQHSFDAVVAVNLHRKNQQRLVRGLKFVDGMAFVLPILFLGSQYIPNDAVKKVVEIFGSIVSVFLLALVGISYVLEWRSRLQRHETYLGTNVGLASRLKEAVRRSAQLPETELALLLREVSDSKKEDLTLLKKNDHEEHEAYREALKEVGGQDVKCPICKQSPWLFKKGENRCGACN